MLTATIATLTTTDLSANPIIIVRRELARAARREADRVSAGFEAGWASRDEFKDAWDREKALFERLESAVCRFGGDATDAYYMVYP